MVEWLGLVAGLVAIAAVLSTQMRSLRVLALIAGIIALIHFALSGASLLIIGVAALFVIVNGSRLAQLHMRQRSGSRLAQERELFDHVIKVQAPSQQRRLLDLMTWRDIAAGDVVIEQGDVDPPLVYIAEGSAIVAHDGNQVGTCTSGDFLGEMSLISGQQASATVTAIDAMRVAYFDRDALGHLTHSLPEIGSAIDSAINRSLTDKIVRMNQAADAE